MDSSLRLFWTGLSVLALGVASCSSTTVPLGVDGGGGAGGPTDGPKTDGPKTDGPKADAPKTDGATSDAKDATTGPDLNVPPPAMLTATVLDRRATTFELLWTAPANGTAAVSGYQVRYAKVPITAANFDDTTMTTAVAYTGTPKAPGDTDGMVVKAYIENGYYFAVTGTDPGGAHVGAFMATDAAVSAHFNVTTLAGTSGANENFGRSVSGDGDLDGDGLSDIAVGTSGVGKAYLFLGTAAFGASAPAVVFTASSTGFGYAVAQIGDIDNDGLGDLAIADPVNGQKVYIYKGRHTWPMTLTDAQADYVISTDASYASSAFGFSVARLGDFTGDGIDDFAIGARGYATSTGRIVIVPGKQSGFASIALPDTTHAITIDGDSTLTGSFLAYRVLGLGHFFTVSAGTTLVVSAPGSTSTAPTDPGRVYAFHGQAGTAGAISISAADNLLVGPGAGAHIGNVLTNLETMLNGFPALGMGNLHDTIDIPGGQGGASLTSGTPATGPFGSPLIARISGGSVNGAILIGGGISGRDTKLSLIGDATPDLVLGGEGGPTLTISDGAKMGGKASPNDTTSTAEVTISLPAGWSSNEGADSIIPDINGDGAPDFCVGSSAQPGAVVVYW